MAKITRSIEDGHTWFIDSGYTQHITSKSNFFSKLEPAVGSVKIGNGDKVAIKGKGTIKIHTATGIKYIYDIILYLNLNKIC